MSILSNFKNKILVLKYNIIQSYSHIPYTWAHKKAIIKLEKELTGKNTPQIILHDTDKIFIYALCPFLTLHQHKEIHRFFNKHHHFDDVAILPEKYIKEMILDWESARYTKADKPYTCREYCELTRPWLMIYFEKHLDEWKI